MSKKFAQEVIDILSSKEGSKQIRINDARDACDAELSSGRKASKKKDDPADVGEVAAEGDAA